MPRLQESYTCCTQHIAEKRSSPSILGFCSWLPLKFDLSSTLSLCGYFGGTLETNATFQLTGEQLHHETQNRCEWRKEIFYRPLFKIGSLRFVLSASQYPSAFEGK